MVLCIPFIFHTCFWRLINSKYAQNGRWNANGARTPMLYSVRQSRRLGPCDVTLTERAVHEPYRRFLILCEAVQYTVLGRLGFTQRNPHISSLVTPPPSRAISPATFPFALVKGPFRCSSRSVRRFSFEFEFNCLSLTFEWLVTNVAMMLIVMKEIWILSIINFKIFTFDLVFSC